MQTIIAPKEFITDLWGKQQIKEQTKYRLLNYVLKVERNSIVLLHNTVTGHLIVLNEQEISILNSLPAIYHPAMRELVAEHFLIPEGFNEYRTVNQLRSIYRKRFTGNAINRYIILPTTFCNAHCFYCYESDYPRVHMSEETASKIVDYIHDHRQDKKVSLSWFGGEPLVGISRIDQITKGLKDLGIPFSSSMISNGYLFNDEIIDRAVNLWNLKRIQITLDGTEEVYNRVKQYSDVHDNPFYRVLNNIDALSKHKIAVNIRLNVDYYNKEDIGVLIEYLEDRYSENANVTVYLNMLFNNVGYEPVHHSQDDILELQDIIDAYTERLNRISAKHGGVIPSLIFSQCMADDPHAVEVQPDGSFCRCEHESILENYGSVFEGIREPQKITKWRESIERSDYCPDCCLYPSCFHLKHCMNADRPCIENMRMKAIDKCKDQLYIEYIKKLEEMKDEGI